MVTTVTNNSPQAINTSLFSLEREMNKNIEDVSKVANKTAKAIEKINTEGTVVSVNNKQGIVTLTASDVGALPDTTTIPSKTSQLTNDSGFITSSSLSAYVPTSRTVNGKALSSNISLTASDVGALPDTTHIPSDPVQSNWTETNTSSLAYIKNKPSIPSKTSQLTNDSGFIMQSELLDFCYPVGSVYWTSNASFNPNTSFGGTWSRIKDRFVYAMGDSDTLNATGGAKTVTLTSANLPKHTHSFTPSGSISVTTNPTFTGSEHSHTYTPSGKIASTSGGTDNKTATESSHTHTLNSGNTSSAGTKTTAGIRHSGSTGAMSANATGSITNITIRDGSTPTYSGNISIEGFVSSNDEGTRAAFGYGTLKTNVAHTHSLPASYIYGKTDAGSAHSHTAYFTGTQATLKATAGGSISGGAYKFTGTASNTGDGGFSNTAVDKMPPYICKYCWERTA